ncbi:hypothetical protein DSM3645_21749 [Blastopirellula marina DSM 3645]|uniref:SHOCT domain-containing protein n=1 Tax=Blastopirellula marina DSM 3645 TaxID=314230 RepID=A3ZUA5_9BACT|nr:hypothetical protein DSM3645_21749 [Blastopirellula marina DSM 3645]
MDAESFLNLGQGIVLLVLSLVALVLAFQIMRRFRDRAGDDLPEQETLLSNFRELHSRGALSDEEFRKIKTDISTQIRNSVGDSLDDPPAGSQSDV